MSLSLISEQRCFGGVIAVYDHVSTATKGTMRFSIFLPSAARDKKVPAITWLSGLTCSHDNFTSKAGAYKQAEALGLIIIAPDTSPRGEGVPDDDAYDFGQGAGFYLDATVQPWAKHFQMESYITKDLQECLLENFAIDPSRQGIAGHSMGGHGALLLGLKYPNLYKSISAFAPIAAASACPWGQKALAGYLGEDKAVWAGYDASAVMRAQKNRKDCPPILVHQGTADQFLETQLKPHLLAEAAAVVDQKITLEMAEGYDHSYYFITSFIAQHLDHHAAILKAL